MRKILITGASNGLGFALAEHFLSNGETVVINTRTPTTDRTVTGLYENYVCKQTEL